MFTLRARQEECSYNKCNIQKIIKIIYIDAADREEGLGQQHGYI